jgi:predicted RNA-binding Zn-ribbon protein involved in translation (DUF1610 family)
MSEPVELLQCSTCSRLSFQVENLAVLVCCNCGARLVIDDIRWEAAPYVCPGCHAVGGERCAPGCIDAEIEEKHREAIESGDYDRFDDDGEDGS